MAIALMRGVHFVRYDGRTDGRTEERIKYPYAPFSVTTFLGIHLLLYGTSDSCHKPLLRSPVRRFMSYFFNKSYQRSHDVTSDSSYKTYWVINMMYLFFSFSRYSQSRPCSIAMYCTSHLTLHDLVILYERNTGVLCFQPSITYSYLQDIQHYYGLLKNVTIKIRGLSWTSRFQFRSLLLYLVALKSNARFNVSRQASRKSF